MSSYTTNEIRGGMKLLIDGDPYAVIENEYVKPGKGQAFNRIRVRNLRTGRTVEKSYRSGESIEAADVMDTEMQYLYKDGDFWTFMNPENYEQLQAGEAAVGDAAQVAQGRHRLHHHAVERRAAGGDAAAAYRAQGRRDGSGRARRYRHRRQKPAKLETGAVVRVPLFINEGEVLRIDTRTGEYISRGKCDRLELASDV